MWDKPLICSSSIYQFPGAERISHPITYLRNTRKYALTVEEVKICSQWFTKIDGKVWTDITYPADFMEVISIDKTGENFHLIYDTTHYFAVHRITLEKAKYKLCIVEKIIVGTKESLIWWMVLLTPSATLTPCQGEHHSDWFGDWQGYWFHQVCYW